MKIPSLDKEFPSQHLDHGFALAIQWFFIESVIEHLGILRVVVVIV